MKYCTHCGKELFDDAVMCPGCGVMVAAPEIPQKKAREKKPVNKKKVIKVSLISLVALLVIVGGVFGFFMFRNYSHAQKLEEQLVGKTYEYQGTDEITGDYSVCWLFFDEGGEYRCEVADFTMEDVEQTTGSYSVEVSSDGTANLWVDAFDFAFTIQENAEGEVEAFSIGRDTYYPIERDPAYALLYWFESEMFQKRLEENKQEALEMFANISYWDTGDKFDNLIPIIFREYDLTCEPQGDSNTEFEITVSGPYYVNKIDLPNFTQQGELVCHVTIDEEESVLTIKSDTGIVEAMKLYVILKTYSSYGW